MPKSKGRKEKSKQPPLQMKRQQQRFLPSAAYFLGATLRGMPRRVWLCFVAFSVLIGVVLRQHADRSKASREQDISTFGGFLSFMPRYPFRCLLPAARAFVTAIALGDCHRDQR